jgi:hypothetical protein
VVRTLCPLGGCGGWRHGGLPAAVTVTACRRNPAYTKLELRERMRCLRPLLLRRRLLLLLMLLSRWGQDAFTGATDFSQRRLDRHGHRHARGRYPVVGRHGLPQRVWHGHVVD